MTRTGTGVDVTRTTEVRRVAVVRALALGDLLCAVPTFRSIRAAWPEAHVTLIGLPWAAKLPARFPRYIDGFIEFPGWHGIPERPYDRARALEFARALPGEGFDLAVQLHGDGSHINGFLHAIPSRQHAGFVPADTERDARVPAERFPEYPNGLPEPLRLLRLAEHLGWPALDPRLEFPLTEADRAEAQALLRAAGLVPGGYVCLHPGATSAQRWPLDCFAALADRLLASGQRVVVTGVEAERELGAYLRVHTAGGVVDLTGATSLGGLGAVIDQSRLLIANDTGVSHLAAALRVPSVVIFLSSDPARWAPLDRSLHTVVGHGVVGHVVMGHEVVGRGGSGADVAGPVPHPTRVADLALSHLEGAA